MKARKGYLPADSIYPFRGLNTLEPSPQANVHTSPDLVNMDVVKGALRKRRGYSFMGSAFDDPIQALIEFEDVSGNAFQIAITTRKRFKWSGTSWTDISGAVTWDGTESDWVEATAVAGINGSAVYKKWLLVTNGKNTPVYWDGSGNFAAFAPTGITNFKTYRSARFFYDHLMLANVTYTSGAPSRNVIYWSDTTKLLDFAGTYGGAVLIPDAQGDIWKLLDLGDRLCIYSENSVHTATYVGGSQLYTFEKVLNDTRLVSARSIVNVSAFHLYLNQENIIFFEGSKLIRVVGDPITRTYREELYVNGRTEAFAFHDPAKQHIYFNIPLGPSTSKVYKIEYNLSDFANSSFTVYEYNDKPRTMGAFSRDVTLTYDSSILAGVTYNACNFTYNQGTVKGGFPIRVFGTTAGKVCLCDDLVTSDSDEAIEAHYDTVDFTVPQEYQSSYARWIELEIEAKGFETLVSYSLNEGQTFQEIENVLLTGAWKKYKIPIDIMTKTLRFRFSNLCVNSKFEIRWIRVWFRPGGPA